MLTPTCTFISNLQQDPYAKDESSHTTIQHIDSAVAPSVPGSPVPMGGINPGLLTQFEDDPDLEIDVVGDGDFMQSSPVALTREDSMSSSYTLSSSSSQDLTAMATDSATVLPTQLIPLHPNAAAIMHMNLPGLHSVAAMPSTPAGTHAPAASAAANGAMKSRAGPYPKRNSERKRHLHNELERKRREDLNQTFFRLGDLLPNFQNANTQPTQVHILQGAATYIHELKERHAQLLSTRATVQQEGQRLQERLRELQAMCAAN